MVDTIKGGLGIADPSKINFYGAQESDLSEYQQSLQDSINALQMRYAQPNWFNVAAGFFKPQLGGFAASLGSASQAMGENVEKQRESQLPIAQMRSQLALSKITMGQNKDAANAFAAWKKSGKPMDENTYSEITALAPNSSTAAAAKAAYEGDRATLDLKAKQTQNTIAQVQARLGIIDSLRASGKLNEADANSQKAALQSQLDALPSAMMVGPSDTAVDKRAAPPPPAAGAAPPPPAAGAVVPPPAAGAAVVPTPVLNTNLPDSLRTNTGNTPRKFNTTASYGTPAKLLDNLMATESSGKATVLNPDTKAMGAYQFLPETAAALHDKGIEFNPLNKQESRAAADWYLQDLLKKNGGDWNKTLAAYGGFKTKDPSDYIKKITSGVDFSKPVEQPVNSESAAAPAAKPIAVTPPDFKYTQSFKLPHVQAVTAPEKAANDAELAKATSANKVREKDYQTLAELNDPRNLSVAQNALAEASSSLKNQPGLAIAVTDQLRRAGSAAAMIDKGVGVSWSPFGGASINIPVQEGLRASLGGAEKTYQDTLINNLATVAYYGLLARGITPESAGAEKFKIQLLQETGIGQTPLAISHQLEQNKHHLMYGQNLYKAYNEALPQVQGFLAPYHEIYTQSPQIKFETDLHNRKLEAERKDYERQVAILYEAEKAAAEAKKKAKKP